MAHTITVLIPRRSQFGQFIKILGVDDPFNPGRVENGSLRGRFQLQIGDRFSEVSSPRRRVAVREVSEDVYELESADPWAFNFTTPVLVRPSRFGPHLSFSRVEVYKFAPDDQFQDAIVSIPSGYIGVSMYMGAPTQASRLIYPTTRFQTVTLADVRYPYFDTPEGNPFDEIYLATRNGELFVHFGMTASRFQYFTIDHLNIAEPEACDVRVHPSRLVGAFRLGTPNDEEIQQEDTLLEFLPRSANNVIADVRVWPETKLALPLEDGKPYRYLSTHRLVCSNLWVKAPRFQAGDWKLNRIHSSDALDDTCVVSSGERLEFWLPLPQSNDLTDLAGTPHFGYRDDSIGSLTTSFQNDETDRRRRYYGLRIRGLGSSQEQQAKLDSSALRIGLVTHANDLARTFEFKSGTGIELGDEGIDSKLVPKPNRRFGEARVLDVPVKQAALRVAFDSNIDYSPLQFDTTQFGQELKSALPTLQVPPGVRSTNVQSSRSFETTLSQDFQTVQLRLESNDHTSRDGQVFFTANDSGVFPVDGADWSERFGLFGDTVTLASLEPPGMTVKLDPPQNVSRASQRSRIETQVIQKRWKDSDPFERAIFRQLNFGVEYDPVVYEVTPEEHLLPESNIVVSRDDLDIPSPLVLENGIDRLLLIYSSIASGGEMAFRRWVDDNEPNTTKPKFLWAVAPTLAIILKQDGRYAFDIARDELRGGSNAKPGLCFNFSARHPVPPEAMGFQSDWADVDRSSPLLWPQSFQRNGDRRDPSVDDWRGYFVRDLPCQVGLADDFAEFPVLAELVREINDRLILKYAWRDEKGWTWKARTDLPDEGLDFTPDGFERYLTFTLLSFETCGAGGEPLLASGLVRISLERIRDGENQPFAVEGSFSFDLVNGTFGRLSIDLPRDEAIDTDSIPGVEAIRVDRFETDLRHLFISIRLDPDDDFESYLPILSPEIEATISVDLITASIDRFVITILLPTEKKTVLFGFFPLSLQAIRVEFGERQGMDRNVTFVHGRLGLGRDTFASVGCTIQAIRQEDSPWQLSVAVDEISGGISIGSVRADVSVRWNDPVNNDPGGLVPAGDRRIHQRAFWGSIRLSGLPAIDDVTLNIRIGSGGQFPFWVAAARLGNVSIGPARLRDSIGIFSQNADIIQGGQPVVQTALTDVASDRFRAIFPRGNGNEDLEWLSRWQPSQEAGALVCFSAYLEFGGVFAKPPANPDRLRDATTVAHAEGGLLRISSILVFFELEPVAIALSYEKTQNRERYFASFDLPRFGISSDVSIDGGQLVLGFGKPPFYRLSLGWPELIGNSPVERDWSDAVKVVIQGAWPINTYWGGIFFQYEEGGNSSSTLIVGIAVRAGWTFTRKINKGPATGSADIGFAFGGVIELTYSWGDEELTPKLRATKKIVHAIEIANRVGNNLSNRVRRRGSNELANAIEALHPHILFQLAAANRGLELAKLSLYADVWGKAAAQFMGVEVANIEISGKARFHAEGWDPIESMTASVSFSFSVRVGCVTHSVNAGVDVTLIER